MKLIPVGPSNFAKIDDEDEAARVYDEAAFKRHGEFARLNFPIGG